MKRGLVEVADPAVHEQRLGNLRAQLREQGISAALIYGDVYRSDDIAHLTNLCVYWNEGVIAVPADRPPALLAKLSKRVHPWMERTSILKDLRSSQNLPQLVSDYLAELPAGAVAFVESDWWPGKLLEEVSTAVESREVIKLADVVRRMRLVADDADRADLIQAGRIVSASLDAAQALGPDAAPTTRIAAVELTARGDGARDVLAFCQPTPTDGATVEVAVQYANVWTYGARTLSPDPAQFAPLLSGYDAARDALAPGVTRNELAERARAAADGLEIELTLTHHCDLATAGDYRPASDTAEPLRAGAAVALQLRANLGDAMPAVLADTFLVTDSGATAITGATAEVSA